METSSDSSRRCRVFYCDPMQSDQKGSLENNHILLRYICPKKEDLCALGLTSEKALNTVISHIRSMPVEKLGGKSPLELTQFMFPELYSKLYDYGICIIDVASLC